MVGIYGKIGAAAEIIMPITLSDPDMCARRGVVAEAEVEVLVLIRIEVSLSALVHI